MRSYKLIRDVKTKAGNEFKNGEALDLREFGSDYPYLAVLVAEDGRTLKLPCGVAHKYLAGFPKPPSVATMGKWSFDGVAKSVTGQRVEPDGHGPDGSPSWLLVMGMI